LSRLTSFVSIQRVEARALLLVTRDGYFHLLELYGPGYAPELFEKVSIYVIKFKNAKDPQKNPKLVLRKGKDKEEDLTDDSDSAEDEYSDSFFSCYLFLFVFIFIV
jgi:hypothetical protein